MSNKMIPPVFSLYGSSFASVSKEESQCIQNFLSPKEIASTIHHVNKTWLRLWGNDGQLDFSDCPDLTDEGFVYVVNSSLKQLNASHCRITDRIRELLAKLPFLQVNLFSCKMLCKDRVSK